MARVLRGAFLAGLAVVLAAMSVGGAAFGQRMGTAPTGSVNPAAAVPWLWVAGGCPRAGDGRRRDGATTAFPEATGALDRT